MGGGLEKAGRHGCAFSQACCRGINKREGNHGAALTFRSFFSGKREQKEGKINGVEGPKRFLNINEAWQEAGFSSRGRLYQRRRVSSESLEAERRDESRETG